MAKPKEIIKEDKKELNEVLENIEHKKDSVIFVGSGVVWAGKKKGNKSFCKFNKNFLYETSNKQEIETLRELGYPEADYNELENLINCGGDYREMIKQIYINKGKKKVKSPGCVSMNEVLKRNE